MHNFRTVYGSSLVETIQFVSYLKLYGIFKILAHILSLTITYLWALKGLEMPWVNCNKKTANPWFYWICGVFTKAARSGIEQFDKVWEGKPSISNRSQTHIKKGGTERHSTLLTQARMLAHPLLIHMGRGKILAHPCPQITKDWWFLISL